MEFLQRGGKGGKATQRGPERRVRYQYEKNHKPCMEREPPGRGSVRPDAARRNLLVAEAMLRRRLKKRIRA